MSVGDPPPTLPARGIRRALPSRKSKSDCACRQERKAATWSHPPSKTVPLGKQAQGEEGRSSDSIECPSRVRCRTNTNRVGESRATNAGGSISPGKPPWRRGPCLEEFTPQ